MRQPLIAHTTTLSYVDQAQRACLRLVSASAMGSPTLAQLAAEDVVGHALSLLVVLDAAGIERGENATLAARLRAAAEMFEAKVEERRHAAE